MPISNIQYYNQSEVSSSWEDRISLISKSKPSFMNSKILTRHKNGKRNLNNLLLESLSSVNWPNEPQLNSEYINKIKEGENIYDFTFANPLIKDKVNVQTDK